jgi:hypothetical protein
LDWRLFGWLDARTETREADSPVSVGFSGECRRSAFKGGCDFMTRNYQSVVEPQLAMPGNLHELVRGQEQRLLKELDRILISPESATGIVPCPEGAPCYEMPAA